jgi:hypothetical protein
LSGNFAADFLTTEGYVLVDPDQRGAVDRAAAARHFELDGTIRHGGGFLRLSRYTESRNNGRRCRSTTPYCARSRPATTVARFDPVDGNSNDYHQTFSAIAANRATERLTVDQRVPSNSVGGSGQMAHRDRARRR